MSNPTISVVIPSLNEAENIEPLVGEIMAVSARIPLLEIIYVNDGSTDNTVDVLTTLRHRVPQIRVLNHDKKSGQSAAMMTGARAARGDLVVTMDGDGQNDPADIPKLYNAFLNNQDNDWLGMVAGQRVKRQDSWSKKISSRIANKIRAFLLNDGVRDTGCSLKLIRRDVYVRLPYFSHMHRYLPALVKREGFTIELVDVSHRPRTRGVSKYNNLQRALVGITDLFGVMWLQRRAKMPGRIDEI
jgi:dolichol-phosphate mannosyltransferase